MHTLDVTLRERSGVSLLSLPSATIAVPRIRLLSSFDRLESAGIALRWVRQATPVRTAEPEVWSILERFLDDLDEPTPPAAPTALLVVAGLLLLQALGYAIELDRCVSCGRPCPAERSAHVDAARGGLVCRRCGGTGLTLTGAARARLKEASRGMPALEPEDLQVAVELVETGLLAHANVRSD
jgi:DNA repair protein RecO (recombination protein O)